jgi:ubiquinone/menaquinone biosynthesis C-methylase UbiE
MRFESSSPLSPQFSPEFTVACSVACEIAHLPAGVLLKLGPTTALVYLPRLLHPPPDTLQLRFDLPGAERVVTLDAVVLGTSRPDKEGISLQLGFADDTIHWEDIERFLARRLLATAGEVLERDPVLADVARGRIVAPAELAPLREALQFPIEGRVSDESGRAAAPCTVEAYGMERFLVSPSAHFEQPIGAWLHLRWQAQQELYYTYVGLAARHGERLVCGPPALVARYPLLTSDCGKGQPALRVVIPLPYPPGKTLTREVVELTEHGLAFRLRPDEPYFLPGTPLMNLEIIDPTGAAPIKRAAHVFQVEPQHAPDGQSRSLLVRVRFDLSAVGYARGYRGAAAPSTRPRVGVFRRLAVAVSELWPKTEARIATTSGAGLVSRTEIDVVRYMNARRQWIVGLLNMTRTDPTGPLSAPVVVIPPAFGKRKESTSAVALSIVESFRRAGRDVVVLRYDGVHCMGESFKDAGCRAENRENLHMTLSQAVEDIHTTLDFAYDNPRFTPTEVILLSFSIQGAVGRRAVFEDGGRRIHQWIGIMGAPAVRELIRNGSGGVDYIGNFARGQRAGVVPILGVPIDTDRFCRDALDNRFAFLADAKREVAQIPIPITWLLGAHDAWIDPMTVREFLDAPAPAPRHFATLPTGHLPLNRDDAMLLAEQVVHHIARHLGDSSITPVLPDLRTFLRVRRAEWGRTHKPPLSDVQGYWHRYLLGDHESQISFDAMAATEEYAEFAARQIRLLDPRPGQTIADLGCGTGNLARALVEMMAWRPRRRCERLVLADLVPQAVEESARKLRIFAEEHPTATLPAIETHAMNLDIDPLVTLRRFVAGELDDFEPLKGAIRNISDYTLDLWRNTKEERFAAILRGAPTEEGDLRALLESLGEEERAVALDMNRIARLVRGELQSADLDAEGQAALAHGAPVALSHLCLSSLVPESHTGQERLPFEDNCLDGIVSSIVLSYLRNPLETLREFHRCLKPGGRIVISSMQPDADMGKVYLRLVRRIESGEPVAIPHGISRASFLESVRAFANAAAVLVALAEEGQFTFFSPAELTELAREAGFVGVRSELAFGSPPLAHICVAYKPRTG